MANHQLLGLIGASINGTNNNKQRRQQVIIKHLVQLETVINDDSTDETARQILAMPEDIRNAFFQVSGTEMIANLLEKVNVNEGSTWAELRVAQPR